MSADGHADGNGHHTGARAELLDRARSLVRRSDHLSELFRSSRRTLRRLRTAGGTVGYLTGRGSFDGLPDRVAVRIAYDVLLERPPDRLGTDTFVDWMAGSMTKHGMVSTIVGSDECALSVFSELGPSIHFGRGAFVRSLPVARRILDLGGSSRSHSAGALVSFGYPYAFEQLVIVELPADERHHHYLDVIESDTLQTHLGPVTFRYHSMTDLRGLPDASFDLVYSGQSIEHVTPDDADRMLAEVRRVLRPDGVLALDTPNGAVCRLQQAEFIDPDHEVEYTHAEMTAKLTAAGYRIERTHGLNFAGASIAVGRFDPLDTARRWGLFDDVERCYVLAYVCRPAG